MLAATIAVRYRSLSEIAKRVEKLPANLELALQDVDYAHSEAGVTRWRLQAERVERSAGQGEIAVRNLTLRFFDEDGKRQFNLKADEGKADKEFNEIRAAGHVLVESERGYRLMAEELVFSQPERTLRSMDPVLLEFKNMSVEGNALMLDLESQTMTVYNGVKAILPMSGSAR